MKERPWWIDDLFRSIIADGCFDSRHYWRRQETMRKFLEQRMPSEPTAEAELREAALEELSFADSKRVERALAFLLVVGRSADVERLEPLTHSQENIVRNGAKACIFELRRKHDA